MRPRLIASVVFVCISAVALAEDQPREIRGRVIDAAGRPVADADVATFWSANGLPRDQFEALVKNIEENVHEIWSREGDMQPRGEAPARTDGNGEFAIKCRERDYKLMALDKNHRRGGVATLDPAHPDRPVVIRLQRLVRVRGTFRRSGSSAPPEWAHAFISLPLHPRFPLGRDRLVGCGSYESRFEFLLPPGEYLLHGNSDTPYSETKPDRTLVVTGDPREVELGELELVPAETFEDRIEKAKARGTWGDYTRHYGSAPPRWYAKEARGISKDAGIAELKGKWVALYFWSASCPPCLGNGLPSLMQFYEEHNSQRDEFEILAICLDPQGEIKNLRELDRQLEPVVENVWGGKPLPFPVLLDSSFRNYESFGLESIGQLLLIDPQGRLIKGDLETLAEKLR